MVVVLLLALLGVLVDGLLLRPNRLWSADRLFASGHYFAALQEYTHLAQEAETGPVLLRLGIVRTLRGEFPEAEARLWHALSRDLEPAPHELAGLYVGHVLASRGQLAEGRDAWRDETHCGATPEQCPYAGPRMVREAEWLLTSGDPAAAREHYRAALALPLPPDWHALARYRLALLQAAADPAQAQATLAAPPRHTAPTEPLLRPLLPLSPAESDDATARLAAVLRAAPPERARLLGQLYRDAGLARLALEQFEQAQAGAADTLAVAMQVAQARFAMGQPDASLRQVRRLAAQHPRDPRATTLLAMLQIAASDTITETATLSTTLRALPRRRAETHLAWAAWHLQQSNYLAASGAYQEALALAPPDERGRYALLVADFHLSTAYELCSDGLAAARVAVDALPERADAWASLAAHRYQCSDFEGARRAAQQALELADTPRADALYYLGAAHARQGNREAAYPLLLQAADLAPASVWRERAELLLGMQP
jgi:tetratricopeptide (TPR) repeat protein